MNIAFLKDYDVEMYKEIVETNYYSFSEDRVKDCVVIDIGANVGVASIFASSFDPIMVISAEPSKSTFNKFLENISISGAKNIVPINKLVSNKSGDLVKLSLNDNSGANSIHNVDDNYEFVETIDFRELLSMANGHKIFLKLDCEGSEFDLLMNATVEDLKNVKIIAMEVHSDLHPVYKRRQELEEKLRSLGFESEVIAPMYYFQYDGQGNLIAQTEIFISRQIWFNKNVEATAPIQHEIAVEPKLESQTSKKYSIVIPTYNHCDDLLKPCVEAILNYTNMSEVELIISANGCVDNTREYLDQLTNSFTSLGFGDHIKTIWHDDPLGYSRATNEGIKAATGEYIILFNNDAFLLPQERHRWIRQLSEPFTHNPKCGISCLIKGPSEPAGHHFAVFFLVMIHRRVFDRIGLLNEEYGVGGGEDTEFCIEAERAGFEVCECVPKEWSNDANLYIGDFPIWHKGEGTVHDATLVPDWSNIFFLNSLKLAKKYNKPWFDAKTQGLTIDHERLKKQDAFIYDEIFVSNHYRIQPEEIRDRTVIDIGANVGMFSLRCHELGAKDIYAVEAQPTIFRKFLVENTLPFKTIHPLNYAVHSDFGGQVTIANEGGLSKVGSEGESVETITLEKLLVDNRIQNNDLVLKLDCEGSEFDILLFTRSDVIKRFSTIYMELHGNSNPNPLFCDPNLVRFYLQKAGFHMVHQVQLLSQDPKTGELSIPLGVFVEKWVKEQ